jgi:hypothetical protein
MASSDSLIQYDRRSTWCRRRWGIMGYKRGTSEDRTILAWPAYMSFCWGREDADVRSLERFQAFAKGRNLERRAWNELLQSFLRSQTIKWNTPDFNYIDKAVWHQADPITKAERWAMISFYEVR